ncbi:MAG: hypothetical protein P8K78_07450, partial [Pirellulales bacterium]|nr:hypothetical protein [Pirellulales bacterium]
LKEEEEGRQKEEAGRKEEEGRQKEEEGRQKEEESRQKEEAVVSLHERRTDGSSIRSSADANKKPLSLWLGGFSFNTPQGGQSLMPGVLHSVPA